MVTQTKKAFTLIELLIVITIFGILSVLLFRTMGDMIKANARVQQEKVLAQELISVQTTVNNLAEQYPYVNLDQYQNLSSTQWFVSKLILQNNSGDILTIQGTGDCTPSCFLQGQINNEAIFPITNQDLTKVGNIVFKLLPTIYYTGSQYTSQSSTITTISAPGFWIFGSLTNNIKNNAPNKVSYTLQHFINTQEKEVTLQTSGESDKNMQIQQAQEFVE